MEQQFAMITLRKMIIHPHSERGLGHLFTIDDVNSSALANWAIFPRLSLGSFGRRLSLVIVLQAVVCGTKQPMPF
jgi:hypothetical protein